MPLISGLKEEKLPWFKEYSLKTIFFLFILGAAEIFAFAAPYSFKSFVPNLHIYMHISDLELKKLFSLLGWATLFFALPGGIIADRFNIKRLTSVSCLLVASLTLFWGILVIFGGSISETILVIFYRFIYFFWAFSISLFFWSPFLKLVKFIAPKNRFAEATNIQHLFSGLLGFIFIFFGALIARALATKNPFLSFGFFAIAISLLLFLVGISILIFIPYEAKEIKKLEGSNSKKHLQNIFKLLLNPKIWLLGVISLGFYLYWSAIQLFYLIQILDNVLLFPTWSVILLGGVSLFLFRVVVSFKFGSYLDSRGKSYLGANVVLTIINLLILISWIFLLPNQEGDFENYTTTKKVILTIIAIILFVVGSFATWAQNTIFFPKITEVKIPKNSYGIATAVISLISFSSDAWFFNLTPLITANHRVADRESIWGYKLILFFVLIVFFLALMLNLLLIYLNKRESQNKLKNTQTVSIKGEKITKTQKKIKNSAKNLTKFGEN